MARKVVIVSGIHTSGDKGGMVKKANALRELGHSVRVYAYPSRWSFSMWRKKVRDHDAKGLMHFCENDGSEVVISHSNGSLIMQNATQMGLSVHGWISYGGAASSDKVAYSGSSFDWAISVYNPHDVALRFGSWLPKHPFGRLGYEGYRSNPDGSYDQRWKNVNGASSGFGINHSHYTGRQLSEWVGFDDANINEGHSKLSIHD